MLETLKFWSRGIRLYLALGAGIITVAGAAWAWASATNTVLAVMHAEECYAWLAVGYLATALAIGPALKQFPRLPGRGLLFDARRLLGISAAWFATLHVAIAEVGPLKSASPFTLSPTYQTAFWLGAGALVVLILMAVTSFDAAFRFMGIWWLRLHRLVYVAVLALLWHAFLIGSHAASTGVLLVVGLVALGIMVLHIRNAFVGRQASIWQLLTICYMAILLLAVCNVGLTQHLGYNFLERLNGHHHG